MVTEEIVDEEYGPPVIYRHLYVVGPPVLLASGSTEDGDTGTAGKALVAAEIYLSGSKGRELDDWKLDSNATP